MSGPAVSANGGMQTRFQRILLPIATTGQYSHQLRAATIFASWFDAPLQLVCDDEMGLTGHQALASSLGVAVEPVLCLDDAYGPGLVATANAAGPSLIVASSTAAGRRLAAESGQPVFLAPDRLGHRMPVGPLVVEVGPDTVDQSALALTAVLAEAIGESVRLVVDGANHGRNGAAANDQAVAAEKRLRQMGCDVGVDVLDAEGLPSLVLAGRSRGATGAVIPSDRLNDDDLLEAAADAALGIFVAPSRDPKAGRPAPFDVDLSHPVDHAPAGARLQIMDRDECLARLKRHRVARIGYVEAGWPTVVPVNYRLHHGDIFIRSLAGAKLRVAERGDTVCLELDGYDEALRTGWSVIAHGNLEVIGDPAVLSEAWANDPEPWVASPDWRWLRLIPISITGREVWPTAADQAG